MKEETLRFKDFGWIKDTPKNRSETPRQPHKPKIAECTDCRRKMKTEYVVSVVDNHSLLISGTHPPLGLIHRMEWIERQTCEKCQNKRYWEYETCFSRLGI